MRLKIPFGLRDGQLVEIASVERGLKCGCVCPSCGLTLIANKKPEGGKKVPYFRHQGLTDCEGGLETVLHHASKEILLKHKSIWLPGVYVQFSNYFLEYTELIKEGYLEFDEVKLEHKLENIIPDIIIEKNGKQCLVEITVTHPIDEIKREKINKLGISTIEINLMKCKPISTLSELESEIIGPSYDKKWIFNSDERIVRRGIMGHLRNLEVSEARKILWVSPCPKMLTENGTENIRLTKCSSCKYMFDIERVPWETPTLVKCWGHSKKEVLQMLSKYLDSANFLWDQTTFTFDDSGQVKMLKNYHYRHFH